MGTSPICSICGEFAEYVEHMLLLCPWVEPVWFGGQLNIKLDKGAITSMDRWLLSITNEGVLSVTDREWMSTIIAHKCWHIWKACCKAVMEHKAPHPLSVIRAIQTSCGNFFGGSAFPQSMSECNIIKVNVDVSWRSTIQQLGVGIVLCSALEGFVAALAVLERCKLAKQQDCAHIVLNQTPGRLSMLFKGPFQEAAFVIENFACTSKLAIWAVYISNLPIIPSDALIIRFGVLLASIICSPVKTEKPESSLTKNAAGVSSPNLQLIATTDARNLQGFVHELARGNHSIRSETLAALLGKCGCSF
ncbi:hypothetical protein GBA52_018609 [Prunus armeniaca]|nr:hypothetical protein GBA52_018609 [Prunus armeniaca]